MSYRPDLSPSRDGGPLLVGHLDKAHPFATGAVPEGLVERLEGLGQQPLFATLGFGYCGLCGLAGASGSLLVAGEAGRLYLAPRMIVHCIVDHGYRPPEEFIAAVLATPIWQGGPLALPEKTARHAQIPPRPFGHLPVRYYALRYKQPALFDDGRWDERFADELLGQLIEDARFFRPGAAGVVGLLQDPQYDLPA